MLLAANYISDARPLYCPSSAGMRSVWKSSATVDMGGYSLSHWLSAGGFSAGVLHSGDWRGVTPMVANENVLLSHYAYRNVPLAIYYPWHAYDDGKSSVNRVPGIKPNLHARIGQPMFRTDRELGGRAVMSDAFGKGASLDAMGLPAPGGTRYPTVAQSRGINSFALQGHRDAFNVLYGDGRAAIFSDPQQQIAYHTQWWMDARNSLSVNYYYGNVIEGTSRYQGPFDCSINEPQRFQGTGFSIWHDFDVAGGVDAGVD